MRSPGPSTAVPVGLSSTAMAAGAPWAPAGSAGDRRERAVSFAEFPDLVARLSAWSRRQGFRVPGIQSPPRAPGVDRVLRRVGGEVRTIAVTLRGRRRHDVVSDLVTGILVANGVAREQWPLLLSEALRAVDGSPGSVMACAA